MLPWSVIAHAGMPSFATCRARSAGRFAFPFGPAGKRIELTSYDDDGSVRNEEMFVQNDEALYSAE